MAGLGVTALADRVVAGDPRACARLISWLEDGRADAAAALAGLPAAKALRVGVTGPPGAGKSTLVDGLIRVLRARGHKVGVLAVDPSSPFTGGAILGDRIRMQGHAGDPGVFIRSMGTRGQLGGLSEATDAACRVLAAAGHDVVLVETVGVGQSEIAVRGVADLVLLVLHPEAGDGIQALKAGILEVPDLFVVNKADLPGARATRQAILAMLDEMADLAGPDRGLPAADKVLLVQAAEPDGPLGLGTLADLLLGAREGQWQPRGRDVKSLVRAMVLRRLQEHMDRVPAPEDLEAPEQAAGRWLDAILRHILETGESHGD
ncbi:MAG: methylmalonyl Co-A mutase-associated GTPase MeaB [Candidatus Sericytochromatia bacterium]|nr:methylmalonyl Co-A mutase-associated GTPase MeaB [Candidatus Sericytochromatia bacterium]